MTTKGIIELLRNGETSCLKAEMFSQQPGIYAFFYIGDNFPVVGWGIAKHEIIYIGKTESSQETRDAKTHLITGKTGSSTLRKSIGAILYKEKNLSSIPRNTNDYKNGRFAHFMFDNIGEQIITDWMKRNLALSFYEYPKSKQELEKLESEIIDALIPILNISKNPNNAFGSTLRNLRKDCAKYAMQSRNAKRESSKARATRNIVASSSSRIAYINNISEVDIQVRQIRIISENKHLFPSEKTGNAKSYLLMFEYKGLEFSATYTIGSKDGKSRSGILKLDGSVYADLTNIRARTKLKITKLAEHSYAIQRV